MGGFGPASNIRLFMKKYILLGFIVLVVIGSDQWTKWWAVAHLHRPVKKCPYRQCNDDARKCRRQCRKKISKTLKGTTPVRGRTKRGKIDPKKKKKVAAKRKKVRSKVKVCKDGCKKTQKACKAKHKGAQAKCTKAYKKKYGAWQARVKAMKKSWLCREVKQGWAGAKPTCVVIRGFFHLNYQTNSGAAWGIFGNYPRSFRRPFFIVITIIAIFFIFYLFAFRLEPDQRFMGLALALILGGALGNFADRLRMDYVVDFIQWFVHYGKGKVYYWPTFNIADVAISVGVGLIAIELFFFTPFDEELTDEEKKEGDVAGDSSTEGGAAGGVGEVSSDRIPVAIGLNETIHETGERDPVPPEEPEKAGGSGGVPLVMEDEEPSSEDIPIAAELWDAPSTTQERRAVGLGLPSKKKNENWFSMYLGICEGIAL